MKKTVLFLSIISASGLVMITIYNLMIDAQSWGSDMPASIQTARDYYRHVDPRNFFAIVAPINQALILLTIILFWKEGKAFRLYFIASFLLYGIIGLLTGLYFIPRDVIIFSAPIGDLTQIETALAQWKSMQLVRSFLGLTGILFSIKGLETYYKTNSGT